jgi:hypothetical protein
VEPKLDEYLSVDVLGKDPRPQLVAHRISEGRPATWGAIPRVGSDDFRTASIEMKLERLSLVFAERLVIELAQNVAWDITYNESNDLVVDAALAPV